MDPLHPAGAPEPGATTLETLAYALERAVDVLEAEASLLGVAATTAALTLSSSALHLAANLYDHATAGSVPPASLLEVAHEVRLRLDSALNEVRAAPAN
jgi:hypothetical protein